ncbi:AP-3 complex subunit beta-2 [Stylophora pistillata]|uniref:AP-3 complex subunit beta-2 n=1 Tax=Stylophora pistillata TaxID=50429 RepID=A0A2B4T0T2_STYPI|nr:AP-3 complex subunit beta-2 [Stylophora pistillata]
MSYNAEKPEGDPDAPDARAGGFFSSDFQRHDDLKSMLDSTKDSLKLDAMKRIIGMMADGRDMSDLFAAVVKNVVSKNVEVKKLVYLYLVRYAEEQQDLALLSISTFQKGLKDPNQLIRGSALRVLSSIRVPVIAPIMMLAIKEGVADMSPYVRKTAAHAIPKLHSLDPEQKDCLIEVIEKLLKDKTTLVAGSAVMAFEDVCPDRIDLIHKNYRKLCNLLIDIDEWGQVAVIHMLTRYARTQFIDPNKELLSEEAFYPQSENSDDDDDDDDDESRKEPKKQPYMMDPDHRLLLRTCKPLLQSRNAAVVMAVARVYHHLAPTNEVGIVARSLVRLLRSHREVQSVVLNRQGFQVGSLSHMMNLKANGYQELPHFPEIAPDPSVRNVEIEAVWGISSKKKTGKAKKSSFYSDSESESGSESESDSEEESGSSSGSGEEDDGGDQSKTESEASTKGDSEEDSDASESEEKSSSESETDESSEDSSDISSEDEKIPVKKPRTPVKTTKQQKSPEGKPASDKGNALLILDDLNEPVTPTVGSSSSNIMSPSLASEIESLSFTNDVPTVIAPKLGAGMKMHDFQPIASLAPGATIAVTVGIDFNDTTQPASFSLCTQSSRFPVSIKAPVGELLQACPMTEADFLTKQGKLRGLNESSGTVDIPANLNSEEMVCSKVKEAAAITYIGATSLSEGASTYRFAARTISGGTHVLVTVKVPVDGKSSSITVNCEKMAISSMLVKEIKQALQ